MPTEESAEAAGAERAAADGGRRRGTDGDDDEDPVAELRAALRFAPGDWFVVHSYAGYENKVKTNLETRITSLDMEDFIYQVEVPTREEVEVKNGKRTNVQNKVFPGYILVRMDLTAESYSCVRNTPGVTGFVGATDRADRPAPLSLDEVLKWLAPVVSTDPKKAKLEIKVSTSRWATRSPSPTARSRRCRPRSARSTPTSRSSRCSSRSSVARRRSS